ncbi:MAG: PIN domain-containing protein [Acidimicrobiales bacterium]
MRNRPRWRSSALARAEVLRSLIAAGGDAIGRGRDVLARLDLVRVNDRVLNAAGALRPARVRSLDAIHLATAQLLGTDLGRIATYDARMAAAAAQLDRPVVSPR